MDHGVHGTVRDVVQIVARLAGDGYGGRNVALQQAWGAALHGLLYVDVWPGEIN
jgi:hypothetical protein